MDSRAAIKNNLDTSAMVCGEYLGDLADDELMHRPHEMCNHLNWQIGHLISSEHMMMEACFPGSMPPLPEGFDERYSRDTVANADPQSFDDKETLMQLASEQRAAVLGLLEKQSDSDLAEESPEPFRSYAPSIGAVFNMVGSHWMMHAGQWVIVRRQLGKEIKI